MPRPFDWPDPFLREVQSLRPRRTELADAAGSLLARGRTAEAEKVIDELRRQFPQDAEALLLQGRLLLMQQNFAGAEAAFRRHLELNENSVNGLFQLSLALLRQQKWDEAARALDRAVSLKPDFAQAHANLALAKSRSGDAKGAVESYRNAIRCRPGDAATRAALAEELARAGRTAEAREEVELALKIEPKLERAQKLRDALLRP
jgi:tetratricopeptide (TPR) repeat protein